MSEHERKIRQSNRDMTLLLIPIVAVLGKLIQLFILPDKYFYDSTRMQSMMNGDDKMAWWVGYEDTVEIFDKINYFGFTSIRQWSVSLGIIFTILLIVLISRAKEMELMECIYALMATGILNIYVFNLAKEPIQMAYFFAIMVIIILPINVFIRLLGCCLIYYWESNTFREYYIMMAAMSLVLYFIFVWLRKKEKIKTKQIILAIILCFVAMFTFVYASQYVDRASYDDVMIVRDKYANEGANTTIANYTEINGNYGLFMLNYAYCAIRMMLPIELLLKSPVYAPFVIYQVFILAYWIRTLKNLKELNDNVLLSLTCFTAYLFGSFVFEPDFGSWVRHEAASFPIFYFMAFNDLGKKENNQNIDMIGNEFYETKNA